MLLELVCPKYSMGHSNVSSLLYFCLPRCSIFPDDQVSIQAPSAYYLQLRPMVLSSFKATVTGPRQDVCPSWDSQSPCLRRLKVKLEKWTPFLWWPKRVGRRVWYSVWPWFSMCGESPLMENKDRAWWARSSRTSMNCFNSLPNSALFCWSYVRLSLNSPELVHGC